MVAANREKRSVSGFETGRVSSGIRGVVPVFAEDPKTGDRVHVGAVEAGASFKTLLDALIRKLNVQFAVLLTEEHLRGAMWPESMARRLAERPRSEGFAQVIATNDLEGIWARRGVVPRLYDRPGTLLLWHEGRPYAVTGLPLRDFLGRRRPGRPPVGVVLAWRDAAPEVARRRRAVRRVALFAFLGCVAVIGILFLGVRYAVRRLPRAVARGREKLAGANRELRERVAEVERARDRLLMLNLAVEQSMDGVAVTDLDGVVRYLNPAWARMHGGRPEDLVGRPVSIFHNEEQMERDVAPLNERAMADGSHEGEVGHVRLDGTPFPTWMSCAVLKDAEGRPTGLIGVVRDITERKKAREALAEAHLRLRRVLDAARHVSIIATDPQGVITVFNTGAERMLGYTNDEVIGLRTPELIHLPEEVDARSRELTEEYGRPIRGFDVFVARAREGGWEEREWTYVRKDGARLIVNLVVTAVRDEAGGINGFLGVAMDVTKRKETEQALIRAKIEAESANRAKSLFLANMSHEIRTPMNGVIGMTGLLLDTDLDAEQRSYAEASESSAQSLLALINDILDFSKIEAGRLDLEIIPFDLRVTVEESMETLCVRAAEKGLEMAWLVEGDVPCLLRGDPGRLRQILVNLMGNAIKFTERGEVSLRAFLEHEDAAEAAVRFEVRDTGIGIPPDRLETIFDTFSQVDSSTTRKYGGAGLGLAICKRLVYMMGGRIDVRSEEGKGSAFGFVVTLARQAGAPAAPATPKDVHGRRALVVDDNATNRGFMQARLVTWGLDCETAPGGAEALETLRRALEEEKPFDLAVIDKQMPKMDGLELARRIKADDALASMPLILLTSFGQRGEAQGAWEAGFAAYLTKPVRHSRLLECLRNVLGAARGGGEAPSEIVTEHSLAEARRRRARVLIVEDNVVNQRVALRMLEKLGYRAQCVANGLEAVDAHASMPYDLILMDCQMPDMDGFEATREIRRREAGKRHTPIIAMTAYAMRGDRERCLEAGMDGYIAKPVRGRELAQAVELHLGGRFSEEPEPPSRTELEEAPVFDSKALLERVDGDRGAFRAVMAVFLEDAPLQIETLQGLLDRRDAAALRRQAHTLKGAAANIGAERLHQATVRIEQAADAGDLKRLEACLRGLREEYGALRRVLAERGIEATGEGGPKAP